MAERIALELNIDSKQSVKSLGQLEDRAEQLNEELRKVPLGSKAFNELKQELIGVNKEIKNTELSMEALDNEQVASELGSVAGAVGDVSAAFILLGGSGGALEETVQNIEKAIGVSMAFKGAIEGVASGRKLFNNLLKQSNLLTNINNKATSLASKIYGMFSENIDVTSVSFKSLRAAIIATGIGALVVAVGFLVENFDKLNAFINSTTDSQKKYNESAKQAIDNIGEELSASNKLQKTLSNETISREDKVKAVQELQDQYPNLLSNIDAEKTSIEDINKALKLNTKLVRLKAQQDALQSLRAEEYKEILKAQVDAQTGANKGILEEVQAFGLGTDARELATVKTLESIKVNKENISVLDELEAQIQAEIKALEELGATDGQMTESEKKKTEDRLKRLEDEKKAYEDAQKAFQEWLQSEEDATQARLNNMQKIGDGAIKARNELQDLLNEIAEIEDESELIIEDLTATETAAKLKTTLRIRAVSDEIEQEKQLRLQQLEWEKETQLRELQLSGQLTNDLRAQLEADYRRKREKIINDSNKRALALDTEFIMAGINLVQGSLNAIAQLNEAFAGEDEKSQKQAFERSKKIQIAQALMSSAQGIVNILSAISTIPQPFDAIYKGVQIGILGATTVAQVQKIRNQKFQGSGSTTIDTPNLGAGGGQAPTLQPANTSLSVPQQDNRVYVTETDITETQNQVAVIQEMGSF
tara:strand:+ start:5322 stop:7439 length:2118 start_codon:yes stop_codon:yes gene_type:complete